LDSSFNSLTNKRPESALNEFNEISINTSKIPLGNGNESFQTSKRAVTKQLFSNTPKEGLSSQTERKNYFLGNERANQLQ
jgi:hypothetical protein